MSRNTRAPSLTATNAPPAAAPVGVVVESIPLFAFSVPSLGAVGGPFRDAGEDEAYVVRGSSDEATFLQLFELVQRDARAGRRVYDGRAFPFRRDEWWAKKRRR